MSRRFDAGTTICRRRHLIDLQHEVQRPFRLLPRPRDYGATSRLGAAPPFTFHLSLFTGFLLAPTHSSAPGSASLATNVLRGVREENYEHGGLGPGWQRF